MEARVIGPKADEAVVKAAAAKALQSVVRGKASILILSHISMLALVLEAIQSHRLVLQRLPVISHLLRLGPGVGLAVARRTCHGQLAQLPRGHHLVRSRPRQLPLLMKQLSRGLLFRRHPLGGPRRHRPPEAECG